MDRTVRIVFDGNVVGTVTVEADVAAEPIHLAASVDASLSYRVAGEEFTKDDIAEWWA